MGRLHKTRAVWLSRADSDPMAYLTTTALLHYARRNVGRQFLTLTQKRPFRLEIEKGTIVFRPASGQRFDPELDRYVEEFNKHPSFRPSDYSKDLWSRSYFVSLVATFLSETGHHPSESLEAPEVPSQALDRKVRRLRRRGTSSVPLGQSKPDRVDSSGPEFKRDPAVKAWVLEFADGTCELCRRQAPFYDAYGDPFLELHHVKPLGDGGPDTVTNAVALCPNCHRACHHSHRRPKLSAKLYRQCARLLR
jgi:5-methylcytosine-specific restriction endonuclease McrA